MNPKSIPKRARLRTDRKHPQIKIEFYNADPVYKALSCDAETAQAVVDEINRKIALRIFNVDEFIPPKKSTITLEKFYDIYLKYRSRECELGRLSPRTVTMDHLTIKLFIKTIGSQKHISEITENTINGFIDTLRKKTTQYSKTYRPASINAYLKHLSSAFSYTKTLGIIETNPFIDIKKLPVKKEIRVLTKSEIDRFRKYSRTKTSWHIDSFNLPLWTGCRLESIVKLQDIHLVWEKLNGRKEPFLRLIEKGQKERRVPLLQEPLKLIQDRIEILDSPELYKPILDKIVHPRHYFIAKQRIDQRYIFWEISLANTVTKAFTRAKQDLGIEGPTYHDLRKSFATYALEQGLSLEAIQYILGHSDFRITQASYSKVTLEKMSGEMKKVKVV